MMMTDRPYDDPDTLQELYWRQGLQLDEVADRLDCSPTTIRRHMDKYDIDRRTRGGSVRDPAHFRTRQEDGYEVWNTKVKGTAHTVRVHRLQAVAHFGFEQVAGVHVHHKNRIPWDNRAENFELLAKSDHHSQHADGFDRDPGGRFS